MGFLSGGVIRYGVILSGAAYLQVGTACNLAEGWGKQGRLARRLPKVSTKEPA